MSIWFIYFIYVYILSDAKSCMRAQIRNCELLMQKRMLCLEYGGGACGATAFFCVFQRSFGTFKTQLPLIALKMQHFIYQSCPIQVSKCFNSTGGAPQTWSWCCFPYSETPIFCSNCCSKTSAAHLHPRPFFFTSDPLITSSGKTSHQERLPNCEKSSTAWHRERIEIARKVPQSSIRST